MNIGTTWQIDSSSSDDTSAIGEHLGKACRGGEVIVLASDLGGGKTTLVKGIAKGLGCTETVGSPTFTVRRVYHCRDDLYLHHFDFYRLNEPGVIAHELSEVIDSPKAVVVIEWGDIVNEILPEHRVIISINHVGSDESARKLEIECPPSMAYLKFEEQKSKKRHHKK